MTFWEADVDGPVFEGPGIALDELESTRSGIWPEVGIFGGLSATNKASCAELGEGSPVEGIPGDPGEGNAATRISIGCSELLDSESESRTTMVADRNNESNYPTATDFRK